MKSYNITNRVSKQARKRIKDTIEMHEKYKRAYFWSPRGNAHGRRSAEQFFEENNPDYVLVRGNDKITVSAEYSESCNNCYYSLHIEVNGTRKDIRTLKKLIR